jgi:hypothetical protein
METNTPESHTLWLQITPKQQKFIKTYLETKDRVISVKAAYNCKTDTSASCFADKLMRSWKVQQILAHAGGYTTEGRMLNKQEAMQLVSDRLRDKDIPAVAFTKLFVMFAQLNGWLKRSPSTGLLCEPEDAPEQDINQLVRQMEKQKKEQSNGKENQS